MFDDILNFYDFTNTDTQKINNIKYNKLIENYSFDYASNYQNLCDKTVQKNKCECMIQIIKIIDNKETIKQFFVMDKFETTLFQ